MKTASLEKYLMDGYRLGILFKNSFIIVGDSGSRLVRPYSLSLISGATAAGARVLFKHGAPLPYACFAAKWLKVKAIAYLNLLPPKGRLSLMILKDGKRIAKLPQLKPFLDWKIAEEFQELPDLTKSYISKLLEIAGQAPFPAMIAAISYEECSPLLPIALSRMGFKVTTITLSTESSLSQRQKALQEVMRASRSVVGLLLDPSAMEIQAFNHRMKPVSPTDRASLILSALQKRNFHKFLVPDSMEYLASSIEELGGDVRKYSQKKPPSKLLRTVDAALTRDYHVILRELPWVDPILECLLIASEAASRKPPSDLQDS